MTEFTPKSGVKGLVDADITKVPQMFHASSSTLSNNIPSNLNLTVPIIDFRDINTARTTVVSKIKDAAEKWGFFQVINHNVPLTILEEIQQGVKRFHEEDPEVKKHYTTLTDFKDKKFVYNFNYDLSHSSPMNWRDSFVCYIAPNPPSPEEIPLVCRDVVIEYSKHVMEFGALLFQLLSEALGLDSEMLKKMDCLKDQIGGLQVLHQDCWVDVPPIPGALVVNIGDFMQLITNDKFSSLEHRVRANKDGPRISVACFFSSSLAPNPTVYGPIKELLSDENPAKYREITIPEYTAGYLENTFNGKSYLSNYKI